jgi:hypothetical protein
MLHVELTEFDQSFVSGDQIMVAGELYTIRKVRTKIIHVSPDTWWKKLQNYWWIKREKVETAWLKFRFWIGEE